MVKIAISVFCLFTCLTTTVFGQEPPAAVQTAEPVTGATEALTPPVVRPDTLPAELTQPVTDTITTLTATATGQQRPAADYTDPTTGMEFMAIPGGTFLMGNDQDDSAKPAHEATVKPFLLGRYEVTFAQYEKFCASTGRLIPFDQGWGFGDRPVINVTHQDAIDFTKWLSEKTGRTFRLPSEAEWEFAARGGATTIFPWGEDLGKNNANCQQCGSEWDDRMTAPVGSFAPNGYGLYDVIGNVYEWCLDARHDNYTGAPTDGSAWVTDGVMNEWVNRGGSWYQPASEMAITRRSWDGAGKKRHEYGFRVLLEE